MPNNAGREELTSDYPLTEDDLQRVLVTLGQTIERRRSRMFPARNQAAASLGISRKHLADLEAGSNVSVKILLRVLHGLGIKRLRLGNLMLLTGETGQRRVSMEELASHVEALHRLLSPGDGRRSTKEDAPLLTFRTNGVPEGRNGEPGSSGKGDPPVKGEDAQLEVVEHHANPRFAMVPLAGEISASGSIRYMSKSEIENVEIPAAANAIGEIVFRVRGAGMEHFNIADGDLLTVEPCTAADVMDGEPVVATLNGRAVVGKYFRVANRTRLISREPQFDVAVSADDDFEVIGVIRAIVKPRR